MTILEYQIHIYNYGYGYINVIIALLYRGQFNVLYDEYIKIYTKHGLDNSKDN